MIEMLLWAVGGTWAVMGPLTYSQFFDENRGYDEDLTLFSWFLCGPLIWIYGISRVIGVRFTAEQRRRIWYKKKVPDHLKSKVGKELNKEASI